MEYEVQEFRYNGAYALQDDLMKMAAQGWRLISTFKSGNTKSYDGDKCPTIVVIFGREKKA